MRKFTCHCGRNATTPDTSELYYCRCGQVVSDYIECDAVESAQQQAIHTQTPPRRDKCRHRGAVLRDVPCGCAGKPKVFECALHRECIVKKINHSAAEGFKCCQNCTDWEPIG